MRSVITLQDVLRPVLHTAWEFAFLEASKVFRTASKSFRTLTCKALWFLSRASETTTLADKETTDVRDQVTLVEPRTSLRRNIDTCIGSLNGINDFTGFACRPHGLNLGLILTSHKR